MSHQKEIIEQLKDELQDLNQNLKNNNKETRYFSNIILILTVSQVIIGIIQITLTSTEGNVQKWLAGASLLIFIVIFCTMMRWIYK